MRRLLSITLLSVLLGVLLLAFAVPGMATEGEAPAETTEEADHAESEGETTEETSHAEGEAGDTDHAEEGGDSEHAASEDSDEGQWTGLIGAFAAAVVFGTMAFVSSGTAGLGEDGHH